MSYRQFSYVQAVRRAGERVQEKLPPGSLAVRCPACPQPGINMDPNWRSRPEDERYKDALFFAKDGNVVFIHHQKKLDQDDFSLFDGASSYADNADYTEFMETSKNDEELDREVSVGVTTPPCSRLNAKF